MYENGVRSGLALTLIGTMIGASIAGCGKEDKFKRVYLSGPVAYNGQPVAKGTITFVPLPGTETPMITENINNGRYETKMTGGVPVGKYRVEIVASSPPSAQPPTSDFDVPSTQGMIPAKYNDESTLTLDLSSITDAKMEQPYELSP